jgi:hypothetical protein
MKVRSYIFPVCCLSVYSIIIGLDYFFRWPPAENSDKLMLISILTIFISVNYTLITIFSQYNIYLNYKNLMVAPLVPSKCFIRELINYLKTIENWIFCLSTYFFFIYFMGIKRMFVVSISFILYYVFFSYTLIIVRFLCGHSIKGRNSFYITCLLINSFVMYQVLLISKATNNLFSIILVEYNPFNTIFFLCLMNGRSIWFLFFPYIILSIILFLITRKLSWEKQLEYI